MNDTPDITPSGDGPTDASPDELVRRFIDGELAPADESDALHSIADDQEARDLLRFEVQWAPRMAVRRTDPRPDPGFTDAVMQQVEADSAGASDVSSALDALADRLRAWWGAWQTPVTVRVRPSVALLTAALLAVVAWTVWPSQPVGPAAPTASVGESETPTRTATASESGSATVWTRFVFTSSEAESVAVAGDFSQWEPIPLTPRRVRGQTLWTGLVPVERGEHEYQFVIDGTKWVTDPLAPVKRDDGFGAKNAVLEL